MNEQRAPRRKETFLVLILGIGSTLVVALSALIITGRFFFAMLGVVAGMIVLGFLQYLVWGWPMEHRRDSARRETLHYPR